jgi:tagatose-1,6-bisphosphate aldolase
MLTLEANVATPVTESVEEAVNAPTDVSDVWKVEAPVIPMPPEVTSKAAENEATPAKDDVDTNVALPWAVNPPVTPNPPDVILTLEPN